MSLRDRVLSTPTRKQRAMRVDEWDTTIVIRELDTEQRLKFLSSINPDDVRVDLAPLAPHLPDLIRDEDGGPVFEIADVDTLKSEHPGVVTRVLLAAIDLSDMGDEDAEGNVVLTPSGDSPTE